MQNAKPLRLLLVDDSETFLAALRVVLAGYDGIEIAGEAHSGEQAVALTEALAPDAVFMDLAMPGIGGIEATRCIKTLAAAPPVVLLTLYEDAFYREAAREAGADFFVSKERLRDVLPALLRQLARP